MRLLKNDNIPLEQISDTSFFEFMKIQLKDKATPELCDCLIDNAYYAVFSNFPERKELALHGFREYFPHASLSSMRAKGENLVFIYLKIPTFDKHILVCKYIPCPIEDSLTEKEKRIIKYYRRIENMTER